MQSIKEIQAFIDETEAKLAVWREQKRQALEHARAAEIPELIARVRELGLTAEDLLISAPKKTKSKSSEGGPKKYKDPETGKQWSGRGNVPSWIKGRHYDLFLNPEWNDLPFDASSSNSTQNIIETNTSFEAGATAAVGALAKGDQVDDIQ